MDFNFTLEDAILTLIVRANKYCLICLYEIMFGSSSIKINGKLYKGNLRNVLIFVFLYVSMPDCAQF